MENTSLLLKVDGKDYPVRSCAIKTVLERARISGHALNKVSKTVFAEILNYCMGVASGDSLIKIADEKVSAVHGGDPKDYTVMEMLPLFTLMSNIAFFGSACTIRMERSTRSLSELMRRMQSYAAGSMPIRLTQLTSSLGRRILSVSQRKTALAIASWRSPKQSQRAALWLMQVMVRSSV